LVQTSAFVPSVQKYSGPELKGARTRAGVEDEIPHEGEAMAEPEIDENVDGATAEVSVDKDVAGAEKAGTSETPKRGRGRPPKAKGDGTAKSSPPAPSPLEPRSGADLRS
jgi:hypothetical protein